MAQKPLYFIALVPPEPFKESAWKLKEHFRDRYKSKASLNSPPHITLCPPFILSTKEEELVKALKEKAAGHHPFEVCLQNFGAFPPRVIYIDVDQQPKMSELQAELMGLVPQFAAKESRFDTRPFHPHMTLAFRDLSKQQYRAAWDEFKERELSYCWLAEEFTLLRHNGNRWEEKEQIRLGV